MPRPKGKRALPPGAARYDGGKLPDGFDREHTISIGDWIIDGQPYTPQHAFALFAGIPEPVVEPLPEPLVEEVIIPEPEPPAVEAPPQLSISPPALSVDKGRTEWGDR